MLKIYNTLTRQIEDFKPISDNIVKMYSCGPTVYDYQHIGHMRRYVGDDILIRVLKLNGYKVHHVMNITDVGHLVSDSDTGEDKMEKGAKKFGLGIWQLRDKFEDQFKNSCKELNIQLPQNDDLMHATDFIKEQVALIKTLEKAGYTYQIHDGIYFDTSKFKDYFKLSRQNPEELKKGARVDFVEGKKNASDFALWKFETSYLENGFPRRSMNWWFEGKHAGEPLIKRNASSQEANQALHYFLNEATFDEKKTVGFPGWHIECSAMGMKALGNHFDIHTGGIDHINIHHTNEIAQSEGATGEKFVNFWVHHNFLTVEGQKMSKSLGNFYTVEDIVKKGYDPLALRYLYLQTHYRQEMNFTWEALNASLIAYNRLFSEISNLKSQISNKKLLIGCAQYEQDFLDAVNNDLNISKGLSIVWDLLKSTYPASAKIASLKKFDSVLGLEFFAVREIRNTKYEIPKNILDLVHEREGFRKAGDFGASDEMRKKIHDLGYDVMDTKEGPKVSKI